MKLSMVDMYNRPGRLAEAWPEYYNSLDEYFYSHETTQNPPTLHRGALYAPTRRV